MNDEEQVPHAMLGKRMSLEEIAETLNVKKVPTIHDTEQMDSCSVRKAFVSQKRLGAPKKSRR
jgi:hypothetical protein